jgi:two-component system nitrogen regulation response regulator GlnG
MMDGTADNQPRFMATSQADLSRAMEEGDIRHDLFYRLSGASLHVPALRDRVDDIPLLAEHFFARSEREGAPLKTMTTEAMELVRTHPWPGNVRQLENAIRRLVLTARTDEISKAEVAAVLGNQPESEPAATVEDAEKLSASIGRHLRRYFDLHGNMLPPPGLYARILKEMELPLIEIALEATGGNQAKCADLLGINRNTLRKKITDLDIHVTRRRRLM